MDLPRYKSKEYYPEFKFGMDNRYGDYGNEKMLEKFKRDGELVGDTPLCIKKEGKDFLVHWERKTLEGTEKIPLFWIKPDDIFLEFMDRFVRKEKKSLGFTIIIYREITYGAILSICKFCKEKPNEFKKAVGKAKDINEMVMLSGLRD